MKLFVLFCLVATSLGQQVTEENPIAPEQARQDDTQAQAINTENAVVVAPIQKNDNNLQPSLLDQTITNLPNQFVQAPQFIVPYPLYRNVYPVQPPALYQRELPTPIVHYVPVVFQPLDNQALAPQTRQVSANFGAHLGGLGGGFSAGLSPSGFGGGAALGYGGPYTYYGQTVQSYPSSNYYYYSRSLPEAIALPAQQAQPQPITQPIVHAIPQF